MIAISLNSDYDLEVSGGTLALMETTAQNQALILSMHQGELKEYPLVGVGLSDIVNDHDLDEWKRKITEQLEEDGQRIDTLEITSDGLTIEAEYK